MDLASGSTLRSAPASDLVAVRPGLPVGIDRGEDLASRNDDRAAGLVKAA